MNLQEGREALQLIAKHPETIVWEDFADYSTTSCIDWKNLSVSDNLMYLNSRTIVEQLLSRQSPLYKMIAEKVADLQGNKYVCYDWLMKALARSIAYCTFSEFQAMIELSISIQQAMRKKGVDTIHSIEDLL